VQRRAAYARRNGLGHPEWSGSEALVQELNGFGLTRCHEMNPIHQ
jgi:hypothetical protein